MKRFLALFLVLFCLVQLPLTPAAAQGAAHDERVQQMLEDIIAFHLRESDASSIQQWIDTALTDNAGLGAEWYVLGLSQSGSYDFSAYQQKLRAYLEQNTVRSASTRQKYALAFLASGVRDDSISAVMEETIGQQGVMSWVYGLHLLTNGCESSAATVDSAVAMLLSLQLQDGGWAIQGTTADVDVTAMVLQALAPYAQHEDVDAAISQAVALLAQRQQEDGGFSSYGTPNPESAAQVLTALSALNIDALSDERFLQQGHSMLDAIASFQLEDVSFSHTQGGAASTSATSQVFYALIAYQRFLSGHSPLYVLDNAADAKTAAPAKAELGYKTIALMVIGGLFLVGCLMLLLMGKRHWKNFAALLLIAALATTFVLFTDFQTADSYYTSAVITKENAIGTVTMTIRCDKVAGQADYIPADGVILPETSFPIAQGDSVYTVLTQAARTFSIPLENNGAPGMAYMSGIGHLYELSFGDLSGWVYLVDSESPSVGCDQYMLTDGQRIEWHYTLALGQDLN